MEERLGERRCAHCHGLGLADQLEWIICPGCEGMGEIASGACIHCDGSGGESVVIEIACPRCMGAGFIVSENTFGGSISVDRAHDWRNGRLLQHHRAERGIMNHEQQTRELGLEFNLQRPSSESVEQIPSSRDVEGRVLYPEVDADGDHVHFEMVPMGGDSLLWLTIRRGISPQLAAASLRKIAGLIERHGSRLLQLIEGSEGSISADGEVISGPLRLDYDEHGDLIIPLKNQS